MRSLAEACANNQVPASVAVVIVTREDLPAADVARDLGLEVVVVDPI